MTADFDQRLKQMMREREREHEREQRAHEQKLADEAENRKRAEIAVARAEALRRLPEFEEAIRALRRHRLASLAYLEQHPDYSAHAPIKIWWRKKKKPAGWKVRGWLVPFSGTPTTCWSSQYSGPQPKDMSPRGFAEQGLVTYYIPTIDDKVLSRSPHTDSAAESFDAVITEIADHLSRALRPVG